MLLRLRFLRIFKWLFGGCFAESEKLVMIFLFSKTAKTGFIFLTFCNLGSFFVKNRTRKAKIFFAKSGSNLYF